MAPAHTAIQVSGHMTNVVNVCARLIILATFYIFIPPILSLCVSETKLILVEMLGMMVSR